MKKILYLVSFVFLMSFIPQKQANAQIMMGGALGLDHYLFAQYHDVMQVGPSLNLNIKGFGRKGWATYGFSTGFAYHNTMKDQILDVDSLPIDYNYQFTVPVMYTMEFYINPDVSAFYVGVDVGAQAFFGKYDYVFPSPSTYGENEKTIGAMAFITPRLGIMVPVNDYVVFTFEGGYRIGYGVFDLKYTFDDLPDFDDIELNYSYSIQFKAGFLWSI